MDEFLEELLANFGRTMKRVRRLLDLHKSLHGKQGRPTQQVSDILRGSVVLAAGALDGLVLEVIVAGVPDAARHGLLGGQTAKWVASEPERMVKALAEPDPQAELGALVRDKLARTTFQKSAMIESNLRDVLGVGEPWTAAALALTQSTDVEWTAQDVREVLDAFMARRDRIAHSGDQKANSTGATTIQRPWVDRGVMVIEAVGEAVVQNTTLRLMQEAGAAAAPAEE